MSKKTLLVIAAVAVMLAGATSAYGYYEIWSGWFNSGSLEYDGDTYEYTSGSSTVKDTTAGSVDSFFNYEVNPSTFTCATTDYYIMLWPHTPSGCKDTGQEDQKEVHDGATWIGYAKRFNNMHQEIEDFTVYGTWDTEAGGDYFDYDPRTPTYSAHWIASYSSPLSITGDGGSAGDRIYYSP